MRSLFQNKLYFFYLTVFAFLASLYLFNEFSMDDYNLHIEMGRWMVAHGEVPHIAVGSWYGEETNLPWIAHEWLAQIIFYFIYSFFGESRDLIRVFCFLLCDFFLFFIIRLNREEMEKHYFSSYFYLAIITLSFYGFFVFRPHIFSFFLFFVEIYCLTKFRKTLNAKYLMPIPVLAVLWANLHGGSSALVYVLPFLLFVFNLIPLDKLALSHKFYMDKIPSKESLYLLLSGVLSILGLMINPYGYEMVLYPYVNMLDTNMLTYILEWVPLNITMREHQFLVFPVLIFAWFSLFQTKSKIDLIDFLFLSVFTIMTFKSGRFIMYFSLYSTFCMWKYFNGTPAPLWSSEKERCRHNVRLLIIICVYLIFAAFYKASVGGLMPYDDQLEKHASIFLSVKEEYPKRLWNRISGNEFTVIGVKPFVDGRADAFTGEPFMIANRNMSLSYYDPEDLIHKYKFDSVVLYLSDPMISYIRHNPSRFTLIYAENPLDMPEDYRREAMAFYKILP